MRVVDNSLITRANPQCFRGLLISGLITSRPVHPFSQMEDLSTPYHPQPQRHLWSRTPETTRRTLNRPGDGDRGIRASGSSCAPSGAAAAACRTHDAPQRQAVYQRCCTPRTCTPSLNRDLGSCSSGPSQCIRA